MSAQPKLTDAQRRALVAARDKGGALYALGRGMGGSHKRMRNRLIRDGLIEDYQPHRITAAGREALEAAE